MLALLQHGHELTRGEISERLGLTRTTVSEVLTALRAEGVLSTGRTLAPSGGGRPAQVVRIHPGGVRYVGIDFTHTTVSVCLANAIGEVVAVGTAEYEAPTGWEERVHRGADLVRSLCEQEGLRLGPLAGVAIGLPGPNSATWDGFPRGTTAPEPFPMVRARIREVFGEEFDAPVTVDHHIRYAALQEAAAADALDRGLIYLRLSIGAGGGVLAGSETLLGAHLLAGEIGHMTVDRSEQALACRCGRRGCLETVASMGAVLARWRAATGGNPDWASLEAAVEARDPDAMAILEDTARIVGRVIGASVLVTDPGQVVVAGEVGALLVPVLDVLREEIAAESLTGAQLPVRIVTVDVTRGARGAVTALRAAEGLPAARSCGVARPSSPSSPSSSSALASSSSLASSRGTSPATSPAMSPAMSRAPAAPLGSLALRRPITSLTPLTDSQGAHHVR
ncbi:ROK family protein [Brachybacterium sp. DNPG3]